MNEFDLIRDVFGQQAKALAKQSENNSTIICGIGDDAAVISPPTNQQFVTCTDTLISGRHFPESTDAFSVGYKAVAVNLSDIAAMGAVPHSILLALSLPQKLKDNKDWLVEFAKGLFACCEQFGVQLIGGDTTKSDVLTISITAFGFAEKCVYRHGAKVGDLVAVTGNIGSAAYVLQQILAGQKGEHDYVLNTPSPRVRMGQWLSTQNIASSMMDISDGLLQDLGHICEASQVSVRLDLENIPAHEMLHTLAAEEILAYQLSGGDDYELLFTFAQNKLPTLLSCHLPTAITVIGQVTQKSHSLVELFYKNQPYHYNQHGYLHF